MTSSLFATTVLVSFFVVALPHALPCPAPRTVYADGEVALDASGKPVRRRRRDPSSQDGSIVVQKGFDPEMLAAQRASKERRECPVPKPGGVLGEWLGFHKPRNDGETPQKRVDR